MFERLFDPAKKFITIVSSSVGGIAALFGAAGFLAETTQLSVLGVSELEVSYQQYVMTGAKFFVFVFGHLVLAIIANTFHYWKILLLALVGFLLLTVLKRLSGLRKRRTPTSKTSLKKSQLVGFLFIQSILLVLSLHFLFSYVEIFDQRDLLYQGKLPSAFIEGKPEQPSPFELSYQNLVLLTVLFLIAVSLTENFRQRISRESGLWLNFSLYFPFFLYIVVLFQILLLPINFGGLLVISKNYPIVQVSFTQTDIFPQIQPSKKLALLVEKDKDLLFYSPVDKKSWLVKKEFVKELTFVSKGNIFQKENFINNSSGGTKENESVTRGFQ